MGMDTRTGRGHGAITAINITPLVDVVLVLLIIFMVVVPKLQRQIPVEVPPADPGAIVDGDPIEVKVAADLSVRIWDRGEITESPGVDLATRLAPIVARRSDRLVFVDVDPAVSWRDAVGMMDTIRGVGGAVQPVTIAIKTDEPAP